MFAGIYFVKSDSNLIFVVFNFLKQMINIKIFELVLTAENKNKQILIHHTRMPAQCKCLLINNFRTYGKCEYFRCCIKYSIR